MIYFISRRSIVDTKLSGLEVYFELVLLLVARKVTMITLTALVRNVPQNLTIGIYNR